MAICYLLTILSKITTMRGRLSQQTGREDLVLQHVMVRDRRQSDIQTARREISRIVLRIVINIEARQGKSLQGMYLSTVSRSSVLSSF